MFEEFKRHYRKVSQVVSELSDTYSGHLHIRFEKHQLSAESNISDEEKTKRFEILMRRFLNPNDPLYFQKIWAKLSQEWQSQITLDAKNQIEERIAFLNQFGLGLKVNDEPMTAAKSYQILADGGYFEENAEIAKELSELLTELPIIGPIFWFQFHEYNKFAFELIREINLVITQVEHSQINEIAFDKKNKQVNRCIYCLTDSGKFISEEHIFPESLGNTELILPRGYVCDQCNNGILSELDKALLKFDPIAFLQVQFVNHTKDGKLPKAIFQNMTIERTEPRHIKITAKDKTARIRNLKDLEDGWQSFSFQMRGKRPNMRKVARALFKVGLGLVALNQGLEHVLGTRYDLARAFVQGTTDFPNNLLMRQEVIPYPRVLGSYDPSQGTVFLINIYGLVFILNLEEKPLLELNERLTNARFASVSLGKS